MSLTVTQARAVEDLAAWVMAVEEYHLDAPDEATRDALDARAAAAATLLAADAEQRLRHTGQGRLTRGAVEASRTVRWMAGERS